MSLVSARWLSDEDRARWGQISRKERVAPAVTVGPVPDFKRRTPKATAEAVAQQVLGSMLADRDKFALLVKTMRNIHGAKVEWMTDEQVAELARRVYREQAEAAATRVFNMEGRGRELVVNLDGY